MRTLRYSGVDEIPRHLRPDVPELLRASGAVGVPGQVAGGKDARGNRGGKRPATGAKPGGNSVPGRSKYGAVKVESDGQRFDSKAEHRRWQQLKALASTGAIRELQRQVAFVLIPAQRDENGRARRERKYVADFVYVESGTNRRVVEDVKGFKTPEYTLKRDLMLWRHGISVVEVKA